MARKTESKRIGDATYEVNALGAIEGRVVLTRLIKCAGPAIASGEAGLGAVFKALADSLKEDDLAFLCDRFAAVTHVTLASGKSPSLVDVFDEHFSCNYLAMGEWLAFCFQLNFSSFFDGAVAKLQGLKIAAPSK